MMTKKFILLTVLCSAAILLIGSFFVSDVLGFIVGVVMGCVISVLKIILLARTLDNAINMQKGDISNYMRLQYILRYSLTSIGLVVAALIPFIDLFGAIGGVLSMYLAAYMMKIFFKDDVIPQSGDSVTQDENPLQQ